MNSDIEMSHSIMTNLDTQSAELTCFITADIDKKRARLDYLLKLKQRIDRELKTYPKERLKIIKSKKNRIQYYVKNCENGNGYVYLPKAHEELARSIAQRDYCFLMREAVETEINAIQTAMALNPPFINPDELYDQLPEERRKLVIPLVSPFSSFREQWLEIDYPHLKEYEDMALFTTSRGENVRSKSEYMIAEALTKHDLPYRYEYPLNVGRHFFHPDFMILRERDRKEILWEHLGMMDNPGYAQDAAYKITEYSRSGYYIGENLIITMETSKTSLTPALINEMIEHYLL